MRVRKNQEGLTFLTTNLGELCDSHIFPGRIFWVDRNCHKRAIVLLDLSSRVQPKRLPPDAVKLISEIDTAIGYNQGLEEKNTENPKIWLPSKEISTLPPLKQNTVKKHPEKLSNSP
ncbi:MULTISPECIES: hypothetical protein [Microcoleaceae]|uniref:hypothetical protein n=1 Tax=Microcoleaceae TaxID=1892252 RepID=UPI00187F6100|nr:hypothetical protein [Tychonema sp. LEGE 06208]MBE9163958.1 hypothetical protein [Tychonema sp. LEGE 06208]